MKNINLIQILFLSLLISCSQKEDLGPFCNKGIVEYERCENRISDFTGSIDGCSAIKVAQLYRRNVSKGTRSEIEKEVKEVIPLTNNQNDTIIYAINYKEGGYALVSATKQYYPIIAYAEAGQFDENIHNYGLSMLLDDYYNDIGYLSSLPKDSLFVFEAFWRPYIQYGANSIDGIKTRSGDLLGVLHDSMEEWESEHYIYQSLAAGCPDGMPSSEFNRFCAVAESLTNPDYLDDYMELSFILMPDPNYYIRTKGPLMQTQWHQGSPYNNCTPLVNNVHAPVGCVALAIGQIMRYHEWPSSFSWEDMPYSTYTDSTATFLVGVANAIGTNFGETSISSDENALSALRNTFDYLADDIADYNAFTDYLLIEESLDYYRPVYMGGYRTNQWGGGHAWVCDGYEYTLSGQNYVLKILSTTSPLEYETGTSYGYLGNQNYFHMNWCYSYYSAGWYSRPYSDNHDYDRTVITNIRPNNN